MPGGKKPSGCFLYNLNIMKKDLIESYLSGTLDESQTKELLHWVNASEANKAEFVRVKNMWVTSQLENNNPAIDTDEEYNLFQYRLKKNQIPTAHLIREKLRSYTGIPLVRIALRVAAILILIYSIYISIFYISDKSNITYSEIQTKRGEKSYLKLADGTRIWINSETHLRYPSRLDTKNVEVFLDGEAYFNVSKIPKRRFIVKASGLNISVLGTSFNVKSYSADNITETTLEEGKISITGQTGNKILSQPLILTPNQQVTFINNNPEVTVINPAKQHADNRTKNEEPNQDIRGNIAKPQIIHSEKVDAKLYTSWKDGKLIFKSERFEELALRMERWFNVKIEIKDPELKEIRYTGVFETESIEQALHALSLLFHFQYIIDQNEIKISIKKTQ